MRYDPSMDTGGLRPDPTTDTGTSPLLLAWMIGGSTALWLIVQLIGTNVDLPSGRAGSWPIPAYKDLFESTGTIELPGTVISQSTRGSIGPEIGAILRDKGGEILGFSCAPYIGSTSLSCVYGDQVYDSQRIGKHVRVRLFMMDKWLYPAYRVKLQSGGQVDVPRQNAAIIMEATLDGPKGPQKILSYDESVERLKEYMDKHQPVNLPFITDRLQKSRGRVTIDASTNLSDEY